MHRNCPTVSQLIVVLYFVLDPFKHWDNRLRFLLSGSGNQVHWIHSDGSNYDIWSLHSMISCAVVTFCQKNAQYRSHTIFGKNLVPQITVQYCYNVANLRLSVQGSWKPWPCNGWRKKYRNIYLCTNAPVKSILHLINLCTVNSSRGGLGKLTVSV